MRPTGAGRCRASATRRRRWWSWGWLRPRTAATAPAACSRATAWATGCAALHRAGYANQPTSRTRDDGLALDDCWIAAAVRCAPPANKPTPAERDTCLPYAVRELELLTSARIIVCLGAFAWDAALRILAALGHERLRPRPRFGHGATAVSGRFTLLGCFHPSQQNTFTGRLTEDMLDTILTRARELGSAR